MMALTDDGDLIHGLGYVALYAEYLEETIEKLFSEVIAVNGVRHPKMDRWKISRKLERISQSMSGWEGLTDELARFFSCIDPLKALLKRRNLVIHARIYSHQKTGNVLKPARAGYPEVSGVDDRCLA